MASREGFRDEAQVLTIKGLGPEYAVTLTFIGETGLVPNAPPMDYALSCLCRWLCEPLDECRLSMAKALKVVNAWLYPIELKPSGSGVKMKRKGGKRGDERGN